MSAQTQGPIEFGREPGVRRDGESRDDQTRFMGKADSLKTAGGTNAYRGNVTVSFPDAKIVLRADEMIYDEVAKEIRLAGNVRLELDSK